MKIAIICYYHVDATISLVKYLKKLDGECHGSPTSNRARRRGGVERTRRAPAHSSAPVRPLRKMDPPLL